MKFTRAALIIFIGGCADEYTAGCLNRCEVVSEGCGIREEVCTYYCTDDWAPSAVGCMIDYTGAEAIECNATMSCLADVDDNAG